MVLLFAVFFKKCFKLRIFSVCLREKGGFTVVLVFGDARIVSIDFLEIVIGLYIFNGL